jgi:arylsulfatase A-like enzyme
MLANDVGTLDLNCFGSKDLQTPHLDALAARGWAAEVGKLK